MNATDVTGAAPTVVLLPSNQPPNRFYRGGPRISAFRGEPIGDRRTPEDWVGSTTPVRGHQVLGRTRLPDGMLLADAIESRPVAWLGPEHVHAFGSDTKLLVKLLDAGQRLPVHAHPDAAFARAHLGVGHGKAEAWYVLTAGEVYLGLREDVSIPRLQALVADQDIDAMLQLMHRVPVSPHQTVYVPPGVLHAIGAGVFLVEVQEPEDLSILLEWRDFELDGSADGHLGLGFETALRAVETRARTKAEVANLVRGDCAPGDVLAAESAEFFRLECVAVDGETSVTSGFAVLIMIDGSLTVASQDGSRVAAPRGSAVLAPYAAGQLNLSGRGVALIARPPRPAHPS